MHDQIVGDGEGQAAGLVAFIPVLNGIKVGERNKTAHTAGDLAAGKAADLLNEIFEDGLAEVVKVTVGNLCVLFPALGINRIVGMDNVPHIAENGFPEILAEILRVIIHIKPADVFIEHTAHEITCIGG